MVGSTAHDHLKPSGRKPPKKALSRALSSLEQQLAELQHSEQQQLQQLEEGHELNLILAELIFVQEQCSTIHERHKQWLAAGGPDADSLIQQQLDIAMHQQRMAQLQQQQRQQYAATPHWVLHTLQTASWGDVELALSRNVDDWMAVTRTYYSKLLALSEAAKRPAALQPLLMPDAACEPPNIPGVYSLTSSSMEGNPAWDAAVAEMQAQSRVAYIALLHSCPSIFDAASRNCVTGERAAPDTMHWITVAQRMHFTRSQRLHFKLALQVVWGGVGWGGLGWGGVVGVGWAGWVGWVVWAGVGCACVSPDPSTCCVTPSIQQRFEKMSHLAKGGGGWQSIH
jgi:flavin-binding protein dodecin